EWYLLGDASSIGWWSAPQDRIETAGTRRWLVVRGVTGHGSGFGSHADDWYEVGEDGFVSVLSFQTDLFSASWGIEPAIERKTRVVKSEDHDGIVTVSVESTTSYEGYSRPNDRFPLWTTNRRATFIGIPGTQRFIVDPNHSGMSEAELDPRFGDDVKITTGEFLKYNYRELARLAVNGTAKQKQWLLSYL